MLIGLVIGDVVATQKVPSHEGRKILVVQPLHLDGTDRGDPVLALDAVDAGIGDRVLLTTEGFSAMTAVGGVFYAFYYDSLFPAQVFGIGRSIELILAPIVGGLGTVFGPVVGAFILTPLGELLAAAVEKLGVNSTPTFFVNGKRLAGALSIEEMEKEFAPYLKS